MRDAALAAARAAVVRWDKDAAIAAFEQALVVDATSAEAKRGLGIAQRIGEAGYVFRDVLRSRGSGPEMVIASVGGKKFAVARTETTLEEFRAFWSDGGSTARAERAACRDRESFFRSSRKYSFESPNFAQTGKHPVVCVTWGDAEAFAAWLAQRSAKRYRLPSAAEWLAFAAAAPAIDSCKSNLADASFRAKYRDNDALACNDGFSETAPARSFDAAPGGVYDIGGNVREWVTDCAPGCREHSALGSAWSSASDNADPTQRESFGNAPRSSCWDALRSRAFADTRPLRPA